MTDFKVGDEVVFIDGVKEHYIGLRLHQYTVSYLDYAIDCINLNKPLIVTAVSSATIHINNEHWYARSRFNLKSDKRSNNGKMRFNYVVANDYIEFNGFSKWSKYWK